MSCELLILAKAPRPGLVKTRIARELGQKAATEVYRALLNRLGQALLPLDTHLDLQVTICFTPDDGAEELRPFFRAGSHFRPQRGESLGDRLSNAFHEAFASGQRKVLAIGVDCPGLQASDLRAAELALDSHDLVLGPATDGGYWLIGLRSPQPPLFSGITWSSDQVLKQTMHSAKVLGLSVALLRSLSDIDTAEDWRNLQQPL